MVKDHKTLIGGTMAHTRYLEGIPNVHIHFLEVGRTEVCCHGCHSSVIYEHGKENPAGMQELLRKHAKLHEKCAINGVDFEKWCPDIRFHTEVVNLTKRQEIPLSIQRQ